MQRKSILFFTLLISFALISASFGKAFAATTAVVAATVTAQSVSVTLTTNGSVAYGTLQVSTSEDTTSNGIDDTEIAQNNGNVNIDLDIKGANSSPDSWTLAGTAGANQYVHSFCITTCDSSPSWTPLTTNDQALATSVAALGTQGFDLKLDMPTSSTSFDAQTLNVTITASAS